MSGWLINLLVLLGVLAIVVIAGWFVLSQMNLPEPIRRIILIVGVIVVAVIAIIILLQLPGARLGSRAPPHYASNPSPDIPLPRPSICDGC
jgi:hypothetical protein